MQVRQDRSNPASTTEQAMKLGVKHLTLDTIKLSTKQQMKRLKRKKKGGGDDEDSAEEEPEDAGGFYRSSVCLIISSLFTLLQLSCL